MDNVIKINLYNFMGLFCFLISDLVGMNPNLEDLEHKQNLLTKSARKKSDREKFHDTHKKKIHPNEQTESEPQTELSLSKQKVQLFEELRSADFTTEHLDRFLKLEGSMPTPAYRKQSIMTDPMDKSAYMDFKERFASAYGTTVTEQQKFLEEAFTCYWLRHTSIKEFLNHKHQLIVKTYIAQYITSEKRRKEKKIKEEYQKECPQEHTLIAQYYVDHPMPSTENFVHFLLNERYKIGVFEKGVTLKLLANANGSYTREIFSCGGAESEGKFPVPFIVRTIKILDFNELKNLMKLRYIKEIRRLNMLHLQHPHEYPRLVMLARGEGCNGIFSCVEKNGKQGLQRELWGTISHIAPGLELAKYLDTHSAEDGANVLKFFGVNLANMHKKGIYHGDCSTRNALVKVNKNGKVVVSFIDLGDLQVSSPNNDGMLMDLMRFYGYEMAHYLSAATYERKLAKQNSKQFGFLLDGYLEVNPSARKVIHKNLKDFFQALLDLSPETQKMKTPDIKTKLRERFTESTNKDSDDDLFCDEVLDNLSLLKDNNEYWKLTYWRGPVMEGFKDAILELKPFDRVALQDLQEYWDKQLAHM